MVTYTKQGHDILQRWTWLKKFKTGLTFFLPVLFVLGLLPSLSAQITVDGNPSDWPTALNNTAYVSTYVKDVANADANTDNQFTGGSQDPNLLSTWAWSLGSANDKGDISNAGALMSGNKIYFFGDRTALNGDAAIGFWFFKNNVTMTGTTGGTFTGSHAVGDILVLSHFTNGGGAVTIEVYKWVGSGGSNGTLDKLTASPATNFAVVNTTNWSVPTYGLWAYDPKVGNAGTYYTGSFFEGVIDLASLGNLDPCFTRFLLETRNSQSINASLQDLTFGGFDTKPIASLAPKTVCHGESVTFTASVTGGLAPLQYSFNGGAFTSSNSITFTATTPQTISVVVKGANGCLSEPASAALNINLPSVFGTQPQPQTVCAPNSATFTVAVSATPAPTLQWQVNSGSGWTNLANGGVYSGVTTNTLSISNTTGLNGYQYRAVGTNICGEVLSNAATLTVNTAPTITTQPAPQTVCAPTGTSFTVAASGTPAPTYQWQVSTNGGTSYANLANGGVYSGVTTNTLTISNSTGLGGNMYRAVATNTCGSVNSNAATLTVNTAPAITAHPAPVTVCAPEPASFTVAASGTPAPTYQWQVNTGSGWTNLANGGVYSGVTTTTLSISNTTGLNGYQYRAAATNTCGTVYSNAALLTVEICDTYCTYTQGAYGNDGGKHCIGEPGSTQLSTFDVIQNAIGTYPNDKMVIGKAGQSVYMTNANIDVDAIIEYLPGGGGSKALNAGDVSISNEAGMAQYLKGGRINNTLLAQTMTLGINLGVKSNLSGFTLQANKYLVTAEVEECGSTEIKDCQWVWNATTMQYEVAYTPYEVFDPIPQALYDAISPKTVGGLFAYANKALGGDALATGVSYTMIASAVDMINNAFDECRLFIGWEATAVNPTSYCQPALTTGAGMSREVANETVATTNLKIAAYPNPYNSTVNFNFTAPVSGKALLEVYDLVGRRLAVVFEGQVDAGMQKVVNYNVPSAQRVPLIYRLSIGGKTSFGKLLPGNTD